MSTVEIVSRIEPRRKWSAAEKAALLAEVDAEGSRFARRHRISESLLYNWRSARKAAVGAANGIEPPEFLQLGVVGRTGDDRPAVSAFSAAGMIEVDLPNGIHASMLRKREGIGAGTCGRKGAV